MPKTPRTETRTGKARSGDDSIVSSGLTSDDRPRKRRLAAKHMEGIDDPISDTPASGCSQFSRPSAPTLSNLERLPLELLEAIFFFSFNLNLPIASLVLGRALSSAHIREKIVTQAFSYPNNDLSDAGDIQSAILRQRWFTTALVTKCRKQYYEKWVLQRYRSWTMREVSEVWGGAYLDIGHMTEIHLDSGEHLLTIERYNCGVYHLTQDVIAYRKWPANSLFAEDSRQVHSTMSADEVKCQVQIGPVTTAAERFERFRSLVSDVYKSWVDTKRLPSLGETVRILLMPAKAENCRLPAAMLRGPWTNERLKLLKTMLGVGAEVDFVNSTDGEAASEGLEDAIRESNLTAVRLLLASQMPRLLLHRLRGSQDLPEFQSEDTVNDVEYNWDRSPDPNAYFESEDEASTYLSSLNPVMQQSTDDLDEPADEDPWPTVGVRPTNRHFRIAIIEVGCRDIITELFQAADPRDIDLSDKMIMEWALRKMASGDPCGDYVFKQWDGLKQRLIEEAA